MESPVKKRNLFLQKRKYLFSKTSYTPKPKIAGMLSAGPIMSAF